MILLNCGSGQRPFRKPWVNIDCNAKWHPDVVEDMLNLPYDAETVDVVVSHHTLEHLWSHDAGRFVDEAFRVLKYGGSLVVCVPDMRELARRWLAGEIENYTYMVNLYGAFMGDEADRHKWGYSAVSLVDLLKREHWRHIRKFDYRELEGAEIAKDWWILAMEAVK